MAAHERHPGAVEDIEDVPRRYQPWTAKERAFLNRHYGPTAREPLPSRRIAEVLGRPVEDIWAAARRYGLALRTMGRTQPGLFNRLHRLGWTDGAIASAAGCVRETVLRWRRHNRMPANRACR